MNFSFILVEPSVPENVGASARALKTMGFDSLIVVNSKAHLQPEARWLAHGSEDVLDGIKVYDTLEEALHGMDLVLGTTAKKRRVYADYYSCDEIVPLIESKSTMLENIALVFGREESGLSNEELKLCHLFTGIPMRRKYPSLNLSQSVMIYTWELSRFRKIFEKPVAKTPAAEKSGHLRKMVSDILCRIGYDKESAVFPRIMERTEAAGDKDAGLIMSVCSKLDAFLENKKC